MINQQISNKPNKIKPKTINKKRKVEVLIRMGDPDAWDALPG